MTPPDTTRSAKPARSEAEVYDFRRPMTLARDHGRAIEMAAETFARQWGTHLTSRMRILCGVTVEQVMMLPYDEYISTLPDQTAMFVGTAEDSRATVVLQLPLETTMMWIDLLLGGPGLDGAVAAREHTEIETSLLTDVVQANLHDLRYAFAAVTPLDVKLKGLQYSPQFAQLIPASEPVVVISFSVSTRDRVDTATLMVPGDTMLEQLRAGEQADERSPSDRADAEVAHQRVLATMQTVPVDVSVRLNPLTISPKDVVNVQVGEVILLNHSVSRPLEVVVDDRVLAHAVAGTSGRQLACQVVDFEENER